MNKKKPVYKQSNFFNLIGQSKNKPRLIQRRCISCNQIAWLDSEDEEPLCLTCCIKEDFEELRNELADRNKPTKY